MGPAPAWKFFKIQRSYLVCWPRSSTLSDEPQAQTRWGEGFLFTRRARGLALLRQSRAPAATAIGQSVGLPSNPSSHEIIKKHITKVTCFFMAPGEGFLFAPTKSRGATLSTLRSLACFPLRCLAPFESLFSRNNEKTHHQSDVFFHGSGGGIRTHDQVLTHYPIVS